MPKGSEVEVRAEGDEGNKELDNKEDNNNELGHGSAHVTTSTLYKCINDQHHVHHHHPQHE